MQPSLSVVPSSVPEPPYCADTKANGYRPEFDLPRIQQSRTWLLADNEVRPWLLMLWLHSWGNFPCGSWEDDDELIAASIGCKPEFFVGHKRQLMRGWVRHADGRLYHPFITAQVIEMKSKRRYEADRKKRQRDANLNKQILNVPRDSQRSHGVDQDQDLDLHPTSYLSPTEKSKTTDVVASRAEKRPDPVPFEQIRETWIHMLPELTRPIAIEHWTAARKLLVTSRWRDQLPDIESWQTTFELIRKSKFLMGRTGPRPFKCTLFWIIKPENLLKLYEGVWADG